MKMVIFNIYINYFKFFIGNKPPNVIILMSIFLPLNFLASTQDIAVDGWALTMLSRFLLFIIYNMIFFYYIKFLKI